MNCGIYIRKSREDKDKPSHRLTVQRELLPAHAKAQGWEWQIYDDGHASAARGKTEDLKERGRLEADIRSGKINSVLVIELSRLSRDDSLQDYVAFLHLCSENKVKLATPSRTLDPAQHSDWMLLIMEGGFSSVEMKMLQARMREGRAEAFNKGQFLGGTPPPPYYYDKGNKKVIIDKAQLTKMRLIWGLIETMSAKAIAKKLTMAEITVRRAVSDERLEFCLARRKDPATGDLIPCSWDPCLTPEEAERIKGARRTRKVNGGKCEYASLLSNMGVIYCGYCTRTVKTWRNSRLRKDGTQLSYYGCQVKNDHEACGKSRLVPQVVIDEKILTNLFGVLGKTDDLKKYWIMEQEKNDSSEEIAALTRDETKERERKDRLVKAISNGILTPEDAKKQLTAINGNIADCESRRNALLAQMADPPDWEALDLTREEFDEMEFPDQRTFLKLAIEHIRLFENYAVITYPFPISGDGSRTSRIHLPAPNRGTAKGRTPIYQIKKARIQ